MKTSESQMEFFVELISRSAPQIRVKKMFGEYGLYQDNKFFGMICQNKLFLKSTESLKKILADDGVRPYEGAGVGYYHVPEGLVENEEVLERLLSASLDFVPKVRK